jgi:tetratricopeptide (TPR) repeat protein
VWDLACARLQSCFGSIPPFCRLINCGLILTASFCLTACAEAACTGPRPLEDQLRTHPSAENYSRLGEWFGDKRQFSCAVDSFRAALKLDPNSPRLLYLLGLSLYTAGDIKEAVDAMQQSIQIFPEELKPHLILAAALAQLQQNDEAEAQWKAALQLDPKSTIALDGFSKSLLARGDYGSTIALLQAAPPDDDLALNLALAYAKSDMLDKAADTFEQALRANPSAFQLISALTSVYVTQTRYQDAAALARKYANLHPRDMEAQRLYLRVLVLNSDFVLARPLGNKLLAAAPHDFDFLYLNGILEREGHEYATARAHLQEAVAINPSHYNSRYNLGLVLNELQDFKGAREQFEKAIELGAVEPEVRFALSKSLRSLGETAAAQEQLQLYQQELKMKALRTLAAGKSATAAQEMATGDPKKAAELYREAVDAMPQNALLSYKLALALDRTGDTAAEAESLRHAIQIDPTFALAQHQLGYLESRSGNLAAAEQHFRLAVSAVPGYTQAWMSLAATLGMESRFAEAQEAVATALRMEPENVEAQHLRQALADAQGQH